MKPPKSNPWPTSDISSLHRFHPNLFIVGAGKCGTTALFSYLAQHPKIFPSEEKEPHYYSLELGEEDGPWDGIHHIADLSSYLRLFENARDEAYRMEASASYLYYPHVPNLLKERVPNARILILLRDPVERAFSDFKNQRRIGREKESFENAIKRELAGGRGYLSQGLYARQVKRCFDIFGLSPVSVILYEVFFSDLDGALRDICRWLNIDDAFAFDLAKKHNVGSERVPISYGLYGIARRYGSWMPPLLRHSGKQLLTERVELSEETRTFLKSYYLRDSKELGVLIAKDLSCWDIW